MSVLLSIIFTARISNSSPKQFPLDQNTKPRLLTYSQRAGLFFCPLLSRAEPSSAITAAEQRYRVLRPTRTSSGKLGKAANGATMPAPNPHSITAPHMGQKANHFALNTLKLPLAHKPLPMAVHSQDVKYAMALSLLPTFY